MNAEKLEEARRLLAKCFVEIVKHNKQFDHITSEELLSEIRRFLASTDKAPHHAIIG